MADSAGAPVVGFPHSGGARLQEGVARAGRLRVDLPRAGARQRAADQRHRRARARAAPRTRRRSATLGDGRRPTRGCSSPGRGSSSAVTREIVTAEELGGPRVHARNGVSHLDADDDAPPRDARPRRPGPPSPAGRRRAAAGAAPRAAARRPGRRPCPTTRARSTTCATSPRRLVDGGELLELAPRWARNMVVGFARMEGRPVGVIANQPRYLGGMLDAAASREGRVVRRTSATASGCRSSCSSTRPASARACARSARACIRRGADAAARVRACSTVPRVTVTLRQAYGGAHIVMNSPRPRTRPDARLARRADRRHGRARRRSRSSSAARSRRAPTPPRWPPPTRRSTCRCEVAAAAASSTRSSSPARRASASPPHFGAPAR